MNPCKIFILDDDAFSLAFTKGALQNLGYSDIQLFIDSDQLIAALETETPDVVFLDYLMEPNNGIDIMYIIKQRHPSVKLVFLSGQEEIQIAIEAMQFGATDYIVKGTGAVNKMAKALNRIQGGLSLAS
jgi:DNA-binding NtrC family response regulator